MSAAKQKGTRWESAIVLFLREHGFTWADRIPASGSRDRGDVTPGPGCPVVEAKNEKALALASYVDEANAEAANAGAPFGVTWVHRRGRGSPGDGYVVMDGSSFVLLMHQAGYGPGVSA